MKKSLKNMLWIALGAIACTGCSNDAAEDPAPVTEQGRTVTVVASLSDETKAAFTDGEGIRWVAGDQIKWSNGAVSQELTESDLSENGTRASFTIEVPLNTDGWFHSTTTHPDNNNEVEFTLGNGTGYALAQEQAGVMNARYLFLHSGVGMMQIPAETETIAIDMEIAGSIFRILPYTEQYNDEAIQKVSLISNGNLVGTVAYDHGARTYRGVNDIGWQVSKEVSVSLTEPFVLTDATTRESSKGIYMAVARTAAPLAGYRYTVYTDKASYIFDAMDKQLEVADNTVKNVFLKLENGNRIGNDEYVYDVRYLGDFAPVENTLWSSDAHPEIAQGYWFAQSAPKGTQEWTNMDNINDENKKFYQVSFEIIDNATNAPADWVTCTHAEYGTAWRIALSENTSSQERNATITGTYPQKIDGGYILLPGYETKSVGIRQEAKVEVSATLSNVYNETISKAGETIAAAKLALTINGEAAADVREAMNTYQVSLACGAAKTSVTADGTVTVEFPENKSDKEKNFTLNVNYKGAAIASAAFTQEAGEGGGDEPSQYTYTIRKKNGNGTGALFGMNPNFGQGEDFTITDIQLNGQKVTLDETIAQEVLDQAFKSLEVAEGEVPAGYASYKYDPNAIVAGVENIYADNNMNVHLKTWGEHQYITKFTWYDCTGNELGHWFVFIS